MKTLKEKIEKILENAKNNSPFKECYNDLGWACVECKASRKQITDQLFSLFTKEREKDYFKMEKYLMKYYKESVKENDNASNGYAHSIAIAKQILLVPKENKNV